MERGVWQATVHGVAKSRIQLSNWAHRLETQGGNFQLRSWGRIPSQANFSLCSSGLQLIGWGPHTLLRIIYLKSTDCCYSVAQPCPILCNPMDCSMPGFPILHCLLEFAQTHVHWVSDAIQPSHLLSPLSPLALNLSQHQRVFQWVSFLYQVAKVLELQQVLTVNIQGWFPLELTGLIFLLSKGLSRVFSNILVQKHHFLMFSLLYGPTLTIIYDYWKNHSFAVQTSVGRMVDVYHVYKMPQQQHPGWC